MIISQIKSRIIPVLEKYDVKSASFFGSLARGEETPESDIDLLIEFKGEKSLLDLAGLKLELEELLRRKVDVLTVNSLHPLLKDRILNERVAVL